MLSDSKSLTLVTILTARAPAAIAVIQLSGPDARKLLNECWIAATPSLPSVLNSIRYGAWIGARDGSDPKNESKDPQKSTEDVVVCWTSSECVEVHCHGGPIAANRIVTDLIHRGAIQAANTSTPWLTTSPGTCSSDAWQDLPFASTEVTTAILLDQARGTLDLAINDLRSLKESGETAKASALHDALVSRSRLGLRLISGWKVAIAGPPNAGKSSLLNCILGYSRAIVHAQPGTTRDVLNERTNILGWPITILDTAGLRTADCDVEAEGVHRALEALKDADLILLTIEPNEGVTELHKMLIDSYSTKILGVITKSDLVLTKDIPLKSTDSLEKSITLCSMSSKENLGIDELFQAIIEKLYPDKVLPGTAVPFRQSHLELIQSFRVR